jgi:hypothetical protein
VTADDGPRESPTPILDRLTPLPPQESIMRPRVAVLWIAVGFVIGMALLSGGAQPFLRNHYDRCTAGKPNWGQTGVRRGSDRGQTTL